MPYTTIVAGTSITASWANASVRDQVVTPFASTAARTSAVSSPVEGMLSAITGDDRLEAYTGSAWDRTAWYSSSGRTGGTWTRSATQSINNASLTAISWDTESSDSDGFCTPTSSTITIPASLGGLYAVTCNVSRAANNASNDYLEVVCSTLGTFRTGDVMNLANMTGHHVSFVGPLAAAETIQAKAYQSTGGAVTYTGRIDVYRIGA